MSYNKEKILSLAGINYADKTEEELGSLFQSVLKNGMHGMCFSLYEEGQKPGDFISEAQVRRRMEIIAPYTKWIRSFSCTDRNEIIPMVAKEFGLKTLVGAWLGKDREVNEREINGLIKLTKAGYVDMAAVGNEVLYRGDLAEEELLEYISRVKKEITDIPVGYVDAYYEFTKFPKVADLCDVIYANCYPFWEGCHFDYSLVYMKNMYYQALNAAKGKKVIISETGWPNKGRSVKDAHSSQKNARNYFLNTQLWSQTDDIEIFYFSSFDESWKADAEGDVGAYWGIWDKNGNLKY